MLQRVPVILAVTAHSYGLTLDTDRPRRPQAGGDRRRVARDKSLGDKPVAHPR
jgi:hypothetical protein